MSGSAPLTLVEGVSKTFGRGEMAVRALADINLAVGPGEVVGLRAPSRSGKCTLLNMIACILEPDGGRLVRSGKPVWDGAWKLRDLRILRCETIGFILQFHTLLPFLSALDTVALAMTLDGAEAGAARARARALPDLLQVGRRADAKPALLSGGEAQRVAIAREQEAAVPVVTHDEKIFDRLDRRMGLRDGRIEAEERRAAQRRALARARPTHMPGR